jgi:hypothetical protein
MVCVRYFLGLKETMHRDSSFFEVPNQVGEKQFSIKHWEWSALNLEISTFMRYQWSICPLTIFRWWSILNFLSRYVEMRLWWYRYTLPDTHTHTHTQTPSYMCTQHFIPLRAYNFCSRPRACCLSVSRLTVFTLQLSLALPTTASVFIRLWYSKLNIQARWVG